MVGDEVGCALGCAVGDAVFVAFGAADGAGVGAIVGDDVGTALGCVAGADVGAAVGTCVGAWLGAVVGKLDPTGHSTAAFGQVNTNAENASVVMLQHKTPFHFTLLTSVINVFLNASLSMRTSSLPVSTGRSSIARNVQSLKLIREAKDESR